MSVLHTGSPPSPQPHLRRRTREWCRALAAVARLGGPVWRFPGDRHTSGPKSSPGVPFGPKVAGSPGSPQGRRPGAGRAFYASFVAGGSGTTRSLDAQPPDRARAGPRRYSSGGRQTLGGIRPVGFVTRWYENFGGTVVAFCHMDKTPHRSHISDGGLAPKLGGWVLRNPFDDLPGFFAS